MMNHQSYKDCSREKARNIICERDRRTLRTVFADLQVEFGYGKDIIKVDGKELELTKNAMADLTRMFGADRKFFEQLSSDLKLENDVMKHFVNRYKNTAIALSLNEEGDGVESIYKRTMVSELEIFDHVWISLPDSLVFELGFNGKFEMRVITDFALTPPRRVKDVLNAGVHIEANDSGIAVSQFVYRLICTNGLIGESLKLKRRIHAESDALSVAQSLKDAVKSAFDQTREHLLPAFIATDDIPLDNPSQRIHSFVREHRLSAEVETELLDRVPSLSEGSTYYDLVNLFTAYGRDKQSVGFERLGARLVGENNSHRCIHCQRQM